MKATIVVNGTVVGEMEIGTDVFETSRNAIEYIKLSDINVSLGGDEWAVRGVPAYIVRETEAKASKAVTRSLNTPANVKRSGSRVR